MVKKGKNGGRAFRRKAGLCLALGAVLSLGVEAAALELVPVGRSVGIEMQMEGVMIVGLSQVETDAGQCSPAADAGLEVGDVIVRVGDTATNTAAEFMDAVSKAEGEKLSVTVRRNGEERCYTIEPQAARDGSKQMGLWLRDSVAGIGTITFYDPDSGAYGALGHGITDADTGALLPLGDGEILDATVVDIQPGQVGTPGQLCGHFQEGNSCGTIACNTDCGIFGQLSTPEEGEALPVAGESEITLGSATILANVRGTEVEAFSVEITRLYRGDEPGRSMMLTVTDETLLKLTGGIVQGMSGSPIVQNGKLIGAVTHVLVNDPTRGYGISMEDMLPACPYGLSVDDAA